MQHSKEKHDTKYVCNIQLIQHIGKRDILFTLLKLDHAVYMLTPI